MTREEMIEALNEIKECPIGLKAWYVVALEGAIKALEQEPTEICCATCKHERLDGINYECEFQNECLVEGKRGKYEFAYAKYEPIVEQEPCNDAISREAVIKLFNGNIGSEAAFILHRVKQLPSVTPRRKGHWIAWTDDRNDYYMCSECSYGEEGELKFGEETSFCPHCGAYME